MAALQVSALLWVISQCEGPSHRAAQLITWLLILYQMKHSSAGPLNQCEKL